MICWYRRTQAPTEGREGQNHCVQEDWPGESNQSSAADPAVYTDKVSTIAQRIGQKFTPQKCFTIRVIVYDVWNAHQYTQAKINIVTTYHTLNFCFLFFFCVECRSINSELGYD